jgi:hypothetical protein
MLVHLFPEWPARTEDHVLRNKEGIMVFQALEPTNENIETLEMDIPFDVPS